jgi:hypothetical protein
MLLAVKFDGQAACQGVRDKKIDPAATEVVLPQRLQQAVEASLWPKPMPCLWTEDLRYDLIKEDPLSITVKQGNTVRGSRI